MRVIARGTVFDARSAPASAKFCATTNVLTLADGGLLVGFRTGSGKASTDENLRLMHSADQGATWQPVFAGFETTRDGIPGSIRPSGVTEVQPGKLIGLLKWFDRSDPALPLFNPATAGILPSKILVGESADQGRTWGPLREVPVDPGTTYALSGPVKVLRDGTLALVADRWKMYDDPNPVQHRATVRLSGDGGQTWGPPIVVAQHPEFRVFYADQRMSVNPDDGRIVTMFWTIDDAAGVDAAIHVARGSPDGKTWTEPKSTGIAGQICSPLVLPGGRVLAVYVHRHDPPSLRARRSDDFGQSWMAAEELVFYDSRSGQESGMQGPRDNAEYHVAMHAWTFGRPDAALLPNGDVLVVFYAGDPTAQSIHWVRIEL